MNITPSQISNLGNNEIFVFGSNLKGDHAGGAAKFAVNKFGAEMGNADGIQGNSYAIPTLSGPAHDPSQLEKLKLPLNVIRTYVNKFISFANNNQNLFFYVTPIGCGIAGFTENEIAPLFKDCLGMDNVALPESFINIIGGSLNEKQNKSITKRKIKLTESQLRNVIIESVKKVLSEIY